MNGSIAVLNAGSSSIKFALYAVGSADPLMYRGQVDRLGVSPTLRVSDAAGAQVIEREWPTAGFDHEMATQVILETARDLLRGRPVDGVGHRVVHGGTDFAAPVRIDEGIIAALAKLTPLAPLHQPHNLAPIAAIMKAAPKMPQVACFDTAFHRQQPSLNELFALPRRFSDAGIRRYGFHGLSYEYIAGRLGELAPELSDRRVIVCHLGNGASLCAIRRGVSIATTMGFTAVDGLMMGTRCGTVDPGVLIYLIDEEGMDARAIEDLIYRKSGLLGVSGISSDMRALRASNDPHAVQAIALFVYRIVREIGSLAAALGGLDALVFTGGIGEHDAETRREVAAGCEWLGVRLSKTLNHAGNGCISVEGSSVPVWVIPTNEELMIARHTLAVVGAEQNAPKLRAGSGRQI